MSRDDKPAKRHLNADARRALASETVRRFARQYARRAQKRAEPNDRTYARDVERRVKRMPPTTLDALLSGDD